MEDATEEALWKEKLNAEKLIEGGAVDFILYLSTDSLSKVVETTTVTTGDVYKDSVIYDRFEEEDLPYRILESNMSANGKSYLIFIARTTLEHDDLMESLLKAFGLLLGFLLLTFFALNWILSKTLWKPFYKTLNELKKYDLHANTVVALESTSTKEFKQLNQSLNEMMEKIQSDFQQQKEFTENAAHEMQTPLAVIKANIGLLMQSPNLKQEEMEQLQSIDNTARKMSSLNKALILLAKIENNQFKENVKLSAKEIVSKVLQHYEDALSGKEISVENNITTDINFKLNPALADVLITNLVQNAIRHNFKGGKIRIETKVNSLIISNTGEPLNIKAEDLFVRFKKNYASKESLGLGLSIVKSIVDSFDHTIGYTYENNMHKFSVNFG